VDNEASRPTRELWALLLVNYLKRQPVGRVVSYDYIQGVIKVHPLRTKEGRAIMRQAVADLFRDECVFGVKPGYGLYRI
jgi:hypothetical protein